MMEFNGPFIVTRQPTEEMKLRVVDAVLSQTRRNGIPDEAVSIELKQEGLSEGLKKLWALATISYQPQ